MLGDNQERINFDSDENPEEKISLNKKTIPTALIDSEDKTELTVLEQEVWDLHKVKEEIILAYKEDSEKALLKILKDNSFLFYDLYTRKWGIQPVFREINFGNTFRCDFAWLNDNSSGPEWVLVEIETPQMRLFLANGKPTAPFNAAIEQMRTWDQYFMQHPAETRRIFGAVAKFRFVLVVGTEEEWQTEAAMKWRAYHHNRSNIEIRSMKTFLNSLEEIEKSPADFWSFRDNPVTLSDTKLKEYWRTYSYMDRWRQTLG